MQPSAEEGAEMGDVSGDQVGGPGLNGSLEDGSILFREQFFMCDGSRSGFSHQLGSTQQRVEASLPVFTGEVATSFLRGVTRGEQANIFKVPEAGQSGFPPPCG